MSTNNSNYHNSSLSNRIEKLFLYIERVENSLEIFQPGPLIDNIPTLLKSVKDNVRQLLVEGQENQECMDRLEKSYNRLKKIKSELQENTPFYALFLPMVGILSSITKGGK